MLANAYDRKEISRCCELGCNNNLGKPMELEKFSELITRLGLFIMVGKVVEAK